jgi:inner membrane protein
MDSLTHLVLGAATGELLLGKKLGNKAMLLGALACTIPDCDVILGWINPDPIFQLQTHRSYSHSIFFQLLLALPFAWFSKRWNGQEITFLKWYKFWYIGFFIHSLLDCCTTYGTRLLLPFTDYQVAFNNISVIDPLYTLPFMALIIAAMFFKRESIARRKIVRTSVFISTAYLLFTFVLKFVAHNKFKNNLIERNISYSELNSSPTILNAILWSGIAYNSSSLYCAEYSFLRPTEPIVWHEYDRNLSKLDDFQSEDVETVKWFADGNYFLEQPHPDTLYFYNTKWGRARFDKTKPQETFLFYTVFYKDSSAIKYYAVTPGKFDIKEAFIHLTNRIGL